MRANITKGIVSFCIITAFLFLVPFSVFADSNAAMADTGSTAPEASQMRKLENQLANLQDLIAKQNQEIQKMKTSMPAGGERVQAPTAVVPQGIDKEDFKLAMKESYPWMDNLKMGGDLRLRYEAFANHASEGERMRNSDLFGVNGASTPRDRNRFRIRLRWGLEKQLSSDWKVGFRIATSGDQTTAGSGNADPTSTNTTMGGMFRYKAVWFDQAYAVYTPSLLKEVGPIDYVEFGGGKFKNPFEKYSTKMIWDRDVTPEGLYEKTTLTLWNTEKNVLKWDTTGGQFVLNEATGENQDAQMFGVQTGLDYTTYMFGSSPIESRTGFSYYGYSNYQRVAGTGYNLTRGNTDDLVSGLNTRTEKMQILSLYQELKFYPFNIPTKFWGEFSNNPAADHFFTAANRETGIDSRDSNGFNLGFQVGEAKKKGQWEAFLAYYYVGANSTAGAFADSDLGWYGHTNNKGWNFGGGYALNDFLTLSWNNYVFEPVENYNSNNSSSDRAHFIDYRSQVDIVWKF